MVVRVRRRLTAAKPGSGGDMLGHIRTHTSTSTHGTHTLTDPPHPHPNSMALYGDYFRVGTSATVWRYFSKTDCMKIM